MNKKEQNRLIVLNRMEWVMMTIKEGAQIPVLSLRQANAILAACGKQGTKHHSRRKRYPKERHGR